MIDIGVQISDALDGQKPAMYMVIIMGQVGLGSGIIESMMVRWLAGGLNEL